MSLKKEEEEQVFELIVSVVVTLSVVAHINLIEYSFSVGFAVDLPAPPPPPVQLHQ